MILVVGTGWVLLLVGLVVCMCVVLGLCIALWCKSAFLSWIVLVVAAPPLLLVLCWLLLVVCVGVSCLLAVLVVLLVFWLCPLCLCVCWLACFLLAVALMSVPAFELG